MIKPSQNIFVPPHASVLTSHRGLVLQLAQLHLSHGLQGYQAFCPLILWFWWSTMRADDQATFHVWSQHKVLVGTSCFDGWLLFQISSVYHITFSFKQGSRFIFSVYVIPWFLPSKRYCHRFKIPVPSVFADCQEPLWVSSLLSTLKPGASWSTSAWAGDSTAPWICPPGPNRVCRWKILHCLFWLPVPPDTKLHSSITQDKVSRFSISSLNLHLQLLTRLKAHTVFCLFAQHLRNANCCCAPAPCCGYPHTCRLLTLLCSFSVSLIISKHYSAFNGNNILIMCAWQHVNMLWYAQDIHYACKRPCYLLISIALIKYGLSVLAIFLFYTGRTIGWRHCK